MRPGALRWIAVVPGAIGGALLALVIVHASLSVTLHSETIQNGHIEPVERFLTPLVLGFFFVFVGTTIAPAQKSRTSLALVLAWWIFFGVVLWMMQPLRAELGFRSLGSVIGPILGRIASRE